MNLPLARRVPEVIDKAAIVIRQRVGFAADAEIVFVRCVAPSEPTTRRPPIA